MNLEKNFEYSKVLVQDLKKLILEISLRNEADGMDSMDFLHIVFTSFGFVLGNTIRCVVEEKEGAFELADIFKDCLINNIEDGYKE